MEEEYKKWLSYYWMKTRGDEVVASMSKLDLSKICFEAGWNAALETKSSGGERATNSRSSAMQKDWL